MGEQPIFSCKAHVFHIDPKTKRTWMPASSTAVNVSFFYDSSRSLYRIISVEGQKPVINSTITSNMTFTKTSQKFGQWSDVRANTVYGLGFASEAELQKFIEKFQEVKEANKTVTAKGGATNGSAMTPVTSANASPITLRAGQEVDQHLIDPPNNMTNERRDVKNDDESLLSARPFVSPNTGESPSHQMKTPAGDKSPYVGPNMMDVQQLKYENERLKQALALSSANAKKWEIELATLKNNNARLTSALQESTANVEEWKRQLHTYKEENQRMKVKYQQDLEAKGGGEIADEMRMELQHLRMRYEQLENELARKTDDLKALNAKTNVERDYAEMQKRMELTQGKLDATVVAQEAQRKILTTLNRQLDARVNEIANIQRQIDAALQT